MSRNPVRFTQKQTFNMILLVQKHYVEKALTDKAFAEWLAKEHPEFAGVNENHICTCRNTLDITATRTVSLADRSTDAKRLFDLEMAVNDLRRDMDLLIKQFDEYRRQHR